jgi:Cu/Ag efflux pump CusA
MKIGMKLLQSTLLVSLIIAFTSCGSSNEVAQGGLFSKRKYNKGYHLSLKKDFKKSSEKEELVHLDTDLNNQEQVNPELTAKHNQGVNENLQVSSEEKIEVGKKEVDSEFITLKSMKTNENPKQVAGKTAQEIKTVKGSLKSLAKEKVNSKMKPAGRGSNGSMSNLLFCLLLVLIILGILFYFPGFIGTILMIVIALLIVFFLLRFFGYM